MRKVGYVYFVIPKKESTEELNWFGALYEPFDTDPDRKYLIVYIDKIRRCQKLRLTKVLKWEDLRWCIIDKPYRIKHHRGIFRKYRNSKLYRYTIYKPTALEMRRHSDHYDWTTTTLLKAERGYQHGQFYEGEVTEAYFEYA